MGHYKPINSERFLNDCHEFVFLRCRGNTWFIPYDTIQSRDKERPHPATFPARLPDYCLRLHGRKRQKPDQ